MRIFSVLYDRVVHWVAHPHAERYLAGLSFAESSFFPIPPDVMLAPMTLIRPDRGWRFAFITTVASVAGGVVGYTIGWLVIDSVEPLLMSLGYWDAYIRSIEWFMEWGFLAVLLAGFSPIPYKIFTIASGALHMFLPVFVVASLVGRGGRFFLVAGLVICGGEQMERRVRAHIDIIGWLIVAVGMFGLLLLRLC